MKDDSGNSGNKIGKECCKGLLKLPEESLIAVSLDEHTYPMLPEDAHHLLHMFTETSCSIMK